MASQEMRKYKERIEVRTREGKHTWKKSVRKGTADAIFRESLCHVLCFGNQFSLFLSGETVNR